VAHSILDVARELIDSPAAKAAYADDPAGFMAARGLDGLSNAEIQEAVGFVAEAVPASVARQLVAPPGPASDSLPLARVAAATATEAAVIEAEAGTVDLVALADPSGQLDLPTDLRAAGVEEEEEVEEAEPANAPDLADEELPPEATESHEADAEGEFGTGAADGPEQTRLILHEGDEPDDTGLDDGALATPEPSPDVGDGAESTANDVVDASGEVDEPPDDDFDDVVI
jgi:hypothetical protein